MSGVRHLYVHLPFCAYRCGYCDFVTAVGRQEEHGGYVDALLRELELEHGLLDDDLETVFLGGGTPTFTERKALVRLLAALPEAAEVTVEANPETVTPELAGQLRAAGVDRVSLGAQSFQPRLLETLERRATPVDVRRAFGVLRAAGFDNVSLDLIYGIPGQAGDDLERDLESALALEPEHLSCYELEAKPGTRFTHRHGDELVAQADALEGYFERVVEAVTAAGYRWYETANFCIAPERAGGRDLRSRHNLGYWRGRDYLGIGVGAVSTVAGLRWRNAPGLAGYADALADGQRPPRSHEHLDASTRATERLLLGLRLDEPLPLAGVEGAVDRRALERVERLGLACREHAGTDHEAIHLTPRGRLLGGGVTAELVA